MSRPTSTVSGLISGIDWDTTIRQLMAIERRKTTLLENRKDENETKLSLWSQIQNKVFALQSAMEAMDRRSEFAVKSASSSDSSLVAVTASAAAAEGSHSVEVLQLARAHRIAAQGWADKNATGVGDAGGDFVMQINGATITIADADFSSATTLEQLANLINSSPDNNGLVTASILNDGSSANPFRLVLTADVSGAANRIQITSNPTGLDFSGTRIDVAETASGWSGTSAITTAGTYAGSVNKAFAFTVAGSGAQTVGASDITLNWLDSLGNSGSVVIPNGYSGGNLAVAEGVNLSFGAGDLVGGQTFHVDVFNPELSAAQDARVRIDGIYMNKPANSITDVFAGVTLDLLAAEIGTVVNIAVTNDKQAVRGKIEGFISAYNNLMSDIGMFSKYDAENETAAPLLGDGFLSSMRSRIASVASRKIAGLTPGALYDNLALLGIRTSTNGLLSADSAKLDAALTNNFDDVVDFFTRSFVSQDSKIFLVDSGHKTVSGDYAIQVTYDAAGSVTAASINGQAALVDGVLIRGAQGTALEGLTLGFTRPGSGPGTLNTTFRIAQGIAGEIAGETARINDPDNGTIYFAKDNINKNIESLDRQIEAWDLRLVAVEKRLRRQFTSLETLISKMRNTSNYLSGVLQ